MVDTDMKVQLAGEGHAVEVMAMGVEWSPPLTSEAIDAAAKLLRNDQSLPIALPFERQFPGFEFKIDGVSASVDTTEDRIIDFSEKEASQGKGWSVALRPEFFSCNCGSYSRWATEKPRAISFLRSVVPAALERGAKVSAIGLQYSDAFRWTNGSGGLKHLLRADSRLLPALIVNLKSLWHTHNGWISEGPYGLRVLNLVNVDYALEDANEILRITGQHRVQSKVFGSNTEEHVDVNAIEDFADYLHRANKVAIQNVLNDSTLNMIKMTKVEESNVF